MALHDVDKQNDNRANPSLNSDDNVTNRMAHKTISPSYKKAGNQNSSRLLFGTNTIEGKHDVDTEDIFIGYNPAISTRPVVRIAKTGYDARTATSDQLIFNSDQNVFKIVASNSVNITAGNVSSSAVGRTATSSTVTIPHGLSYIPAVLAYWNNGGQYNPLEHKFTTDASTAHYVNDYIYVTVDATNIYVIVDTELIILVAGARSKNGLSYTVKYYLLQETAN